jgi:hypothetical protein
MNEIFSSQRLWLLLRGDVISGYRSLLTICAAVAGIIFVTAMISGDGPGVSRGFYQSWFGLLLFLWGVIASSRAFRELHDNTKNQAYLLLPASSAEKTVARLFVVTIAFVGFLLVFMTTTSVAVESLNLLLSGERNAFFNPFDPIVWKLIPGYIFLQSLYFLGAAWFRKAHLIKTTLALLLIGGGFATFTLLVCLVLFAPYLGDMGNAVEILQETYKGGIGGVRMGVLILLPMVCWFVAWLRVRETQVSDGV